jgi:uncharacterized protein (TIGR00269 family)
MKCTRCKATAVVALPSHHAGFCEPCFLNFFTAQVEKGIRRLRLLEPGDRVLVAISGGKDSLVLTHELSRLGYDVTGLHVDLAIPGSSEPARAAVEAFCQRRGIPLLVRETAPEGLAIPLVKARLGRPVCSVCGKIKRHYFNKTALDGGFTVLATGHNLDDETARLSSNILRWDTGYLAGQSPRLPPEDGFARKIKPLWRLTEFETATYAFLRGIDWHFDPCPYSGGASFTFHKQVWAGIEEKMPGRKLAFYQGFLERGRPAFAAAGEKNAAELAPCAVCGMPTSQGICGVCRIRAALAR